MFKSLTPIAKLIQTHASYEVTNRSINKRGPEALTASELLLKILLSPYLASGISFSFLISVRDSTDIRFVSRQILPSDCKSQVVGPGFKSRQNQKCPTTELRDNFFKKLQKQDIILSILIISYFSFHVVNVMFITA